MNLLPLLANLKIRPSKPIQMKIEISTKSSPKNMKKIRKNLVNPNLVLKFRYHLWGQSYEGVKLDIVLYYCDDYDNAFRLRGREILRRREGNRLQTGEIETSL